MSENAALLLSGEGLTVETLTAAARGRPSVRLSEDAQARMARSRAVIETAVAEGRPLYGVTTGLGARATEALSAAALTAFSYDTLRGRAHAIGPALPREAVRAAMIVRLNGLATGASGASPAVAAHLAACLSADLTPLVGAIGSIGAADLVLGATMGRALIGEGRMLGEDGPVEAGAALAAAGLTPPELGPRDGLALANHSSFSAALAALACHGAIVAVDAAQTAAALSCEAFRANLSPLYPRVLAARPQAGQETAASGLLARLEGSALREPGQARRLQDPISIRCLAQIHGAALAAVDGLRAAVETEINAAADNPVVLPDSGDALSGGGFMTPMLTLSAETAARALGMLATAQLGRIKALTTERLTGLPQFLETGGGPSNGYAPMLKVAEALTAQVLHAGAATPIFPSLNADGVEDALTNAPLAAQSLSEGVAALGRLTALELVVSTTAIELRAPERPAPFVAATAGKVRAISPPPDAHRSISQELEQLAEAVAEGAFSFALPS